jgi:hypothetical protein
VPTRRREGWKSLVRSTARQLSSLGELVKQKAEQGKTQLDLMMARRDRRKALAAVGELVAQRVAAGQLAVPDEVMDALTRVAELDERIEEISRLAGGHGFAPPPRERSGAAGTGAPGPRRVDLDDELDEELHDQSDEERDHPTDRR